MDATQKVYEPIRSRKSSPPCRHWLKAEQRRTRGSISGQKIVALHQANARLLADISVGILEWPLREYVGVESSLSIWEELMIRLVQNFQSTGKSVLVSLKMSRMALRESAVKLA